MKLVLIHAEASAEAISAMVHYESRSRGLGRKFRLEFEAALARIQRLPQAFAAIDERGPVRVANHVWYAMRFSDHSGNTRLIDRRLEIAACWPAYALLR